MWILGWAKCLISKLHRQHLKAFRNTLPSCVICISHRPHTSPRFNELKWIMDLCCIWTWVALFLLLFLYPCFSSKCLLFKKYSTWWLCHYRPHHMSVHRLPLAGLKASVFTGFNAQRLFKGGWDWIYEHLCGANNIFSRGYEMPFFIQGGLSPPEFRRAFLTGKKVPPWKK